MASTYGLAGVAVFLGGAGTLRRGMGAAGRPAGQAAPENKLQATLVDAHAKPAVDAGSIPAASMKTLAFAGVFYMVYTFPPSWSTTPVRHRRADSSALR
jgi:hypothetical protein